MRLIDADALIDAHYEACNNDWRKAFEMWSRELMDNAPLVDAVEVVRCRDCVNWSEDKTRHCPLVAWWNGANDYCSAGARKGATDDD